MNLLSKIRRLINPPYSSKDLLAIFGVLVILVAIPLTVFLTQEPQSLTSKAATSTITFDKTSSAKTTDIASTLSWSHTVGSGSNRILIVGVTNRTAAGQIVKSVTYGGASLVPIGSINNGANVRVSLWCLLNPNPGTASIQVTLNGDDAIIGGATSWFGVNQTNPTGSFASRSGSSTTPSVSVSSAIGEVVVDVVGATDGDYCSSNCTINVGSDQTWIWSYHTEFGDHDGASSYEIANSSSVVMSWVLSPSRPWAIGAVSLKPAPAPPTCANECSASGVKRCTDGTHYQTCGNYDADSCLEWSSAASCPPGQTCSGSSVCSTSGGGTSGGGSSGGKKISGGGGGTLDSLQLEISVPYLVGTLKAKMGIGSVSKDLAIIATTKSYSLNLKGSNLSLNGEYTLLITSDKTLIRKVKFTPTVASTNLKVADLIPGDINQDNIIDTTDQTSLVNSISSQTLQGDLNADQTTNSIDWAILLTNFGKKGD